MSVPPTPPQPDDFLPDDLALRAALQRHFADHRASPFLHDAVARLATVPPDPPPNAPPNAPNDGTLATLGKSAPARWRRPTWVILGMIAAVALSLLTYVGFTHTRNHILYARHPAQTALALDAYHAAVVPLVEQFPSNRDAANLSSVLSARLGRQVVVPDASAAGWSVTTVGIAELKETRAGYVAFRNHTRTAVMLAFAKSDQLRPGDRFDLRLGDCRVAGVGTPDGLQVFVTAPCAPGADDDLAELYIPVLAALTSGK